MTEQELLDTWRKHYYITIERSSDTVYELDGNRMITAAGMRDLFAVYAPLIRAKHPHVPATYFSGYFVFLATGLQLALSGTQLRPDLSPANLVLELRHIDSKYYSLGFRLKDWRAEYAPASADIRLAWLEASLEQFYGDTARPILEASSEAAGISVSQLWGQLPAKLDYYVDLIRAEAADTDPALVGRIDIVHGMLKTLSPQVFGRTRNPLNVPIRRIESLMDSCQTSVMKSACCLFYQTEGGEYCYTCPRLKEEQRAGIRDAYREKNAASMSG